MEPEQWSEPLQHAVESWLVNVDPYFTAYGIINPYIILYP